MFHDDDRARGDPTTRAGRGQRLGPQLRSIGRVGEDQVEGVAPARAQAGKLKLGVGFAEGLGAIGGLIELGIDFSLKFR